MCSMLIIDRITEDELTPLKEQLAELSAKIDEQVQSLTLCVLENEQYSFCGLSLNVIVSQYCLFKTINNVFF